MIVVNDISRTDIGFDSSLNEIVLVSSKGEQLVSRRSKQACAAAILDTLGNQTARRRRRAAYDGLTRGHPWKHQSCTTRPSLQAIATAGVIARRVIDNVARVIHAPDGLLERCVMALLCEGHMILEDFPGVGKTMLAKSLARSLDCEFARIQATPDLLPVGHHRRQRLQPAGQRVRVPAGTGVREPGAGGRDQPRQPQDAVGAAGVHAGGAGHDRRGAPTGWPARSW